MSMRASAASQVRALIWKNAKMQQRQKIMTAFELLLPALFCFLLAIVRAKVPTTTHPDGANFIPFSPKTIPFWHNKIAYAPANHQTDTVMHRMAQIISACNVTTKCATTSPVQVQGFSDENSMVNFLMETLQNNIGLDNYWLGGVTFNTPQFSLMEQVHYSIRLPSTSRNQFMKTQASTDQYSPLSNDVGWETKRTYPVLRVLGPRKPGDNFGGSPGYYAEGFLSVQYGVDMALAEYLTNNSNASDALGTFLWRFPYPKYTDDLMITIIESNLSLIVMLGFIMFVLNVTRNIVLEKEKRLKEFMKVMGLSNWVHWASHYIWSMTFLTVPIILITVILCAPFSTDKVLKNSDASVVVFFLLIYANSAIMYAFAVSACFTKGNSAAAVAGIMKLVLYLPYFLIQPIYFGLSYSQKVASCLFINTGMALGFQLIGMWEGRGVGIQWSNISSAVSTDDSFSMSTVIAMLLFDSFLCLLITWYVEAVFPGDEGLKQEWLFPFKLSYWKKGRLGNKISNICMFDHGGVDEIQDEENNDEQCRKTSVFEADPMLNPVVQFKMLRKEFKVKKETKVAVDGLNMKFYQGQVTALLGHNGAGKSTTMTMLTGLTGPTSGTALVDEMDISHDMKEIRETLGLCPQYNVLFDKLTVNEHLILYCKLKGIQKWESACQTMLESLKMTDKCDALSCTLSGGMKRKLSVGIALMGDSKLVLLDEPTAGMDPSARRSTWDLLLKARAGRSMILTTHFMEEADLLADRIAIMAEGKIKCCGSSLFLKNRYGDGYRLSLNMDGNLTGIQNLLCEFAPGTVLESKAGMQVTFKLPQNCLDRFEDMFEAMEGRQHQLGIINFGVSETTMEDVFLKVGKKDDGEPEVASQNSSVSLQIDSQIEISENILDKNIDFRILDPVKERGLFLWILQLRALFSKKMYQSIRNWKMLISQLFVVMVLSFLVLFVNDAVPIAGSSNALLLNLDPFMQDSGRLHIPYSTDPNSNKFAITFENEFDGIISVDDVNKIYKSDPFWIPYISGSPISFQKDIFGLLSYLTIKPIKDELNFFDHNIIGSYFQQDNVIKTYIDGLYERNRLNFFSKDRWKQIEKGIEYLNVLYNGSISVEQSGVAFFNDQPYHTPAVSLNAFDNAVFLSWKNSSYTQNTDTMRIQTTNHPLPPVSVDMIAEFRNQQITSFSFGFTLLLGLAFITSSFVVFLIKEQSNRAKHLQYLTGLHPILFWIATFVSDITILLPGNLLVMIPVSVFKLSPFTEDNRMGELFWMLCMYTAAVLPYNYLASFLHSDPTVGYVKTAISALLTGCGCLLIVAIFEIPQLGLVWVREDVLFWLFMILSPHYCLGQALRDFQDNYMASRTCAPILDISDICTQMPENTCCPGCSSGLCLHPADHYFQWNAPGVGRELFFLLLHFLVNWTILLCMEMGYFRKIEHFFKTDRSAEFIKLEESNENRSASDETAGQSYKPLNENDCGSSSIASSSIVSPEDSSNHLNIQENIGNNFKKLSSFSYETSKLNNEDSANVIVDEDVSMEQTKVDASTTEELENKGGVLVLKKLHKEYNKFAAVHHLSLCVNGAECFGLLGVNGAGKTTTFKMITGEETITDGDAFIGGHSITNDWKKAQTSIGYCPQFDGLIDQMTGYETIEMFARLRGIREKLIKPMADMLLDLLTLTSHKNKMTQAYSGGNKRKLSIAVSLIGGPTVLLMDEPTNGVDPGARRHVWKLLSKIQNYGIPIVLTSHSMDECEALCTRIGIMVSGRFKCLGTPQHLRDKFGTGYTILMKVDRIRRVDKAVKVIKDKFPGTMVKEIHQKVIHFQVPKQGTPYSLLFRTVSGLKASLHIIDYSISQTTLEQIFLNFTRENE